MRAGALNLAWRYPRGPTPHVCETQAVRAWKEAFIETDNNEHERVKICEYAQTAYRKFRKAQEHCYRAASFVARGREEDVEKQALKALTYSRGIERDYGPQSSITALDLLVGSYVANGKYELAEPPARELVDRQRQILGDRHPSTIEPMQMLASLTAANGRLGEAARLFEAVQSSCADVYGNAHPTTLKVQSRLQQVLDADAASRGTRMDAATAASSRKAFQDHMWLDHFFG